MLPRHGCRSRKSIPESHQAPDQDTTSTDLGSLWGIAIHLECFAHADAAVDEPLDVLLELVCA